MMLRDRGGRPAGMRARRPARAAMHSEPIMHYCTLSQALVPLALPERSHPSSWSYPPSGAASVALCRSSSGLVYRTGNRAQVDPVSCGRGRYEPPLSDADVGMMRSGRCSSLYLVPRAHPLSGQRSPPVSRPFEFPPCSIVSMHPSRSPAPSRPPIRTADRLCFRSSGRGSLPVG